MNSRNTPLAKRRTLPGVSRTTSRTYPAITALIPLRNRPSVELTVASLLDAGVDRVVVVDAQSTDASTRGALDRLRRNSRVSVHASKGPFLKSRMLNEGLLRARNTYTLVSDADIIWSQASVASLLRGADDSDAIVHIARVIESDPRGSVANRRLYCDLSTPARIRIALDRRGVRPGYGLVLARRASLLRIGGYCEQLVGWGWEDVDLLTRGHALDFRVVSTGSVVHLTHDDALRDLRNGATRITSRNANIITALERYRKHQWFGTLRKEPSPGTRVDILVTAGASRELCAL